MSKQELLASARNIAISDNQVFENLKIYVAEKDKISVITREEAAEFEEVSTMLRELRPKVMEMLRKDVMQDHGNCCCKGLE